MRRTYIQGVLLLTLLAAPISLPASDTLSVRQAVSLAREFHPNVKSASAALSASRGEFWSAISPPPATVGVEYEGVPKGQNVDRYAERRMGISQSMEFPLKYLWRGARGQSEIDRAQAEGLALLLDLETEVRLEYVETWAAGERVRLLEESFTLAETYAQQSKRREELGEIAPLEARRAQVEALQVQRELERERRNRLAAVARLSRLTGRDLKDVVLAAPPEEAIMDTLALPTEASVAGNPELNGLEAGLRSAKHGLTLASLGWLPDLEAGYFQQRVPTESDPDFWGLEVGFSLPVWFWLGGRGDIQTAKAQKRAASAALQAQRLEISSEWDTQRQEYMSGLEQVQTFNDEILPLAKESYDLARRSFDLGEANYLEVLDAQRSFLQTQLGYLESLTTLNNSRIQLDRLSGRSLITNENNRNK
jgi:cobalt-zinc-cadmium efflux system outer membrane protein